MLAPFLTTFPHLEYISALFGVVGSNRKLRPEVGWLCERWRESHPPLDHLAVQITHVLLANHFGMSAALQFGLHHGPFPEFKQVSRYPDALLRMLPVDDLAHQLGLPRDPEALLAAYAAALRDHWELSRFGEMDGILPAAPPPWAGHVPGDDAVRMILRYVAIPLPHTIQFVPLQSLPWSDRYAVRTWHGAEEHVFLFFGEPTPGTKPEQVGHELTRGLLYHLLGGAVSRHLEPLRQAVAESAPLHRVIEARIDPVARLGHDWFYHVRRFTIYAFVSRLFVQQGIEEPPTRDDCRLGTPFQPAYWFYAQVVATEREGACDVGDVLTRIVTSLQTDHPRLLTEWEEPRPFPNCMRNCFMPHWLRRKTLAVVPRSGLGTSDIQRLVASHWGRNFPVVQADQWSPARHGNCNLILFGRPDQSTPLAAWFDRMGRQPAGDQHLSLAEHLQCGHQVLASSRSPWDPGAWVYVHACQEPEAITPFPQAAWALDHFLVLHGGKPVSRGTWTVPTGGH